MREHAGRDCTEKPKKGVPEAVERSKKPPSTYLCSISAALIRNRDPREKQEASGTEAAKPETPVGRSCSQVPDRNRSSAHRPQRSNNVEQEEIPAGGTRRNGGFADPRLFLKLA